MKNRPNRPSLLPSGTVAQWLTANDAGDNRWWQALAETGTPLVEARDEETVLMSFFWRDPAGDEPHSEIEKVYVDINCVTDHHSPQPQSLLRLEGTDIWHWSTPINKQWRGSYSFIPVTAAQRPPVFSEQADVRRQQQREWWISLFPLAQPDALNPLQPHKNSRRHPLSAAHMPHAPDQSAWSGWDRGEAQPPETSRLQTFIWTSERLGNVRRIWLFTTGETDQPDARPLTLLLDGQNWAENLPLFHALNCETESGHLPAACWLFIDVIDMAHREKELPCNAAFWEAVQGELLPLARSRMAFSEAADKTVVAGQSYGGLAAMYAGLHWPSRFGRVLSQSGSFWWPNLKFITLFAERQGHQVGWLTDQVRQGALPDGTLTIFQEAGDREGDMAFVNQQMREALEAAGHQVNFRIFKGGHDALCWRGGLIDGLRWLLADSLPAARR